MSDKKLVRSTRNRKVLGVCSGIGEYFNIDPTIIRVVWILFILGGFGILAYLCCAIIIPNEPSEYYIPKTEEDDDKRQN